MDIASLMRLEKYSLASLVVSTRSDPGPRLRRKDTRSADDGQMDITIEHSVRKHIESARFWVRMELKLNWPNNKRSRFQKIDIGLDGFFSFPDDCTEEQVNQYVPLLCLTCLYGIARGIISQATGLCPGGAFTLPLVDMNKVFSSAQRPSGDALGPRKARRSKPAKPPRSKQRKRK